MPNKELLLQYANLKIQASKIKDELEMLQPQVQAEVEALVSPEAEQVALEDLPGYSFSLAKMPAKWKYSDELQKVIADVEKSKDTEQKNGYAENLNDGKKTVKFNQPKE